MPIQALVGADTFLRTIERSDSSRWVAATRAATLTPSSTSGFAVGGAATISLPDGRDLVSKALDAADAVVSGLRQIQAKAQQARDEGFLNGVPDLSRGTLAADVAVLIDKMDAAVAAATVGINNLVSGSTGEFRIATSGLGGAVTVPVQGLDSRSLGIDRLNLATDAGVEEAIARISSAVTTAGIRAQRLDALSRTFSTQDRFIDDLSAAIASATVDRASPYGRDGAQTRTQAARGSLVNLVA